MRGKADDHLAFLMGCDDILITELCDDVGMKNMQKSRCLQIRRDSKTHANAASERCRNGGGGSEPSPFGRSSLGEGSPGLK